jgi:hypothetical protein
MLVLQAARPRVIEQAASLLEGDADLPAST